MELLDYLKDHKIDTNNPTSDAESVIIDDFIECIKFNIKDSMHHFYSPLMHYIMDQDELSYKEIISLIENMIIYHKKIEDLIDIWLHKDSPLHEYINIEEIEFSIKNFYDSFFEGNIDKFYKLHKNNNFINVIRENAYTENAKKYFNIGG